MDTGPTVDARPNEDEQSGRDLRNFMPPEPIVEMAPVTASSSHTDVSLRKAVRGKIKPWRRSIEKPPFAEQQLVVMALVDEGKPLTANAIYGWIMGRLPYYVKLACEFLWERASHYDDRHLYVPTYFGDGGLAAEAGQFKKRFNEAFVQFEVPITKITLPDDTLIPTPDDMLSDHVQWTISTAEARVYLQPLLHDLSRKDGDWFPFLRLPYELRLRIYEMVFAFPRAGIRLYKKDSHVSPLPMPPPPPISNIIPPPPPPAPIPILQKEMHMESITRDLCDLEAKEKWFVRGHSTNEVFGSIKCQLPSQILSLLLACRSIYQEAMPVFFDINTFVFRSMDEMFNFFRPLRYDRRKHVRSVLLWLSLDTYDGLNGFGYIPDDLKAQQLRDRAEILKTCTGLADLEIVVRNHKGGWFFEESTSWDQEIHQALAIFATLECGQVRIGGDHPTKWEARLAQLREQLRIGRNMICS